MVERVNPLARQLSIGEALTVDAGHSGYEAICVTDALFGFFAATIVVTEYLFTEVTLKMERLDRHVGSAQIALEQAPEILQPVRVYPPVDVPLHVVHPLMHIAIVQQLIRHCAVRIDLAAVLDVLQDDVLQGLTLDIRDNLSANFSRVSIQHPDHSSLADVNVAQALPATNALQCSLAALVHIPSLATDESFIAFYFTTRAAQLRRIAESLVRQNLTDAVKHEPCALLGDLQSPRHLCAAHSVLAVAHHPKCGHPFVESKRGIFEDASNLDRELPLAAFAKPHQASAQKRVLRTAATRANDLPSGPTEIHRINEGPLSVGEVHNRFLKGFGLTQFVLHLFALSLYLMRQYRKGLCV